MDGGAWWAAVHGVTKNRTRLSDFTFTFHFHALEKVWWCELVVKIHFLHMVSSCSEKAMAPHSSTLAWKIPRMEEPGRLQSMGSHRVRHD